MSSKHPEHTLTLIRKERLSDDMVRVWLAPDSSSVDSFKEENEGDYVKLVFATQGDKPVLRTYTVSRVTSEGKEIAIDFVLHGQPSGPASVTAGGYAHHFAHAANPGDMITVIGPNPKKSVLPAYENTLFVADPSALPALESVLRHNEVVGVVVLYNCSDELIAQFQDYELPVYSARSLGELGEALGAHASPATSSVWCAGEYQLMKTVRRYTSDNFNISREFQYFSSYWKPGMTEDGHKAFKQANADQD